MERSKYVDTVGKNAEVIQKYVENQLSENRMAEQLVLDIINPFMGDKK